jgi:DNA-binding transcriptional ArsR family regulator
LSSSSIDRTLSALADPLRRQAVHLLSERPRRAGELSAALGLTAPTTSRHLRVLRNAGLVEETHPPFDARVRIYALRTGAMADLKAWLDEMETLWTRQLSNFKAYVERG